MSDTVSVKKKTFENFLERQKQFQEQKEQKRQHQDDSRCTFKPNINVCSEFLIETN